MKKIIEPAGQFWCTHGKHFAPKENFSAHYHSIKCSGGKTCKECGRKRHDADSEKKRLREQERKMFSPI